MTTEQKKWKGIRINKCTFQGTVINVTANGGFTYLDLESECLGRDTNGQFTEMDQVIPLIAEPESAASKVISKYVQEGRQLHVDCTYKNWTHEGQTYHGFVIEKIKLGSKPYVPKEGTIPF